MVSRRLERLFLCVKFIFLIHSKGILLFMHNMITRAWKLENMERVI